VASDPNTPDDPDATVVRSAATGPDPDATVIRPAATGPEPDATVLHRPAAPDADATVLGLPTEADADGTRLMPPPGAPGSNDGATVLAPPTPFPGADGATMLTPPPVSKPVSRPATRPVSDGPGGPLTVGDTFGRYTIVKMLGIGGMGAVYQAWDKELEVVVALKVIRPEAIRDPAAAEEIERRFKRELLLARQVTHRNVVRIHDLGEIDGIKYITMSYVDGKDLQTVLKEMGRLPIVMTLRIMRAVVSGLVAAHAAGVVHRDLKPANIMIGADGEALIMDFGIARSTGGPAEISAEPKPLQLPEGVKATGRYTDATVLGSIVGTVEYMAPEQARGEAVDQRADIYTYGLILYDMLIGARRAERPGSALDQLRTRMENALPPLKAIAPDVPDALAAIVTKAIDPDATNRYQATVDLADALESLDEHGVPKPIKRVVGLPKVIAALAAVLVLATAGWYFFLRTEPVAAPHDPVSVVIADFDNRTNEPTFDRTLEPTLRRALEGAGFITAYDRNGLLRTVGASLPEKLDEAAAREVAVKQGLGVVLSGAVAKQGSSYTVSMKASYSVTGDLVADVSARASGPDQVVPTATKLVASVRKALGDRTKESDQIFAMTSLSTSSLEVVRIYAAAQEASSNGKFEDARAHLLKAVQIDPNFGIGYLALAGVARNMQQMQDALDYVNQAMSHLDGMTDRERFTTRGMFFRLTFDYKQCVKEHSDLIARFAADVVGHNQLALCASQLRDLKTARDEMREVVRILPKRAVFRDNLALYSNYAGDFETGESEAKIVLEQVPSPPDAFALFALAMSQVGRDQRGPAAETLVALAAVPGRGPTLSASGLADLAVQEGRYTTAARLAEQGAAADLAAKNPDRAAAKLAEAAYAHLLRGQKAAAVATADKALANSKGIKIRFLVARIYVEAGQAAKAQPLMASLAAEVQPEPQAYGKLLEAMIAMAGKDPRPAVKLATDANELFDTWIGHFELGRAYLATNQLPQADSEFDRCLKRRGEALALFLDEEPTYGYFPMVYYYQGRVREGMKLAGAADSYRAYLDIREKAGEDALLADIRRRLKK